MGRETVLDVLLEQLVPILEMFGNMDLAADGVPWLGLAEEVDDLDVARMPKNKTIKTVLLLKSQGNYNVL